LLIVDEAQNLTPHQAKTIITRAGVNTKIILTGDLGQIDRRKMLTPRANGLAYAIATMGGPPSVGVTTFKETVRSHLASLAEERM
jgi:PhoH-like ATPase